MKTAIREIAMSTSSRSASLDQLLAISGLGGSEAPQWSPDGLQVVIVSGIGGASALWSVDPADATLTRLSVGALGGGGLLTAYLPAWSPTGDSIAYVSSRSGSDEVWLWSTDGSADRQLTSFGNRVEAIAWSPDGTVLAVAANTRGSFDIYLVSVADGITTRLTDGERYAVYPAFAPDGRLLYVRLSEDWTGHEVVVISPPFTGPDQSCERVVVTDTDFFDYHYGRSFGAPLVSPDGTSFLFRSQRSGWTTYWGARVDGEGDPWQIAPADADQSDAVWSPDGQSIAYIENHNGTLDLRIVAASGGAPRVLVSPPQGVCTGPAWSPDGSSISYLFGDLTAPNDLWLVQVADGSRRQLTRSMLGGRVRERLVQPEKVRYPTFDGREIDAYVYRPGGQPAAGSCPGIVWVHGGPTSQYMDTYQPQVQFFVSQGYAVIQPNVRGSSGYGRAFEDLNNEDWGGGDLQDVIAARGYLAQLPEVDADHIGITGTSYGGIMTMNAVSFAPNVFQAAVSGSGYCDFLQMHGEQELRHIKLLEFELGTLPEAEDVYARCSALHRVQQATTPCFVLHGEGQYPGSITSKVFAMALEANYKTVWYKAYQGEHYYVRTQTGTRRMLRDMLAFFNMYLMGIPHSLPDDGTRPLTHLSGIITAPATAPTRYPAASASEAGRPPSDMAN